MRENPNRPRLLTLLLIVALVAVVIFLKNASPSSSETDVPEPEPMPSLILLSNVPEEVQEAIGLPADTARPDTVSVDTRPPYEAGYEDGYFAGRDDRNAETPQASYDETCAFPDSLRRALYFAGYREGYAEGLGDNRKTP